MVCLLNLGFSYIRFVSPDLGLFRSFAWNLYLWSCVNHRSVVSSAVVCSGRETYQCVSFSVTGNTNNTFVKICVRHGCRRGGGVDNNTAWYANLTSTLFRSCWKKLASWILIISMHDSFNVFSRCNISNKKREILISIHFLFQSILKWDFVWICLWNDIDVECSFWCCVKDRYNNT